MPGITFVFEESTNIQVKMTIPKNILDRWNLFRERGDLIILAKKTGITYGAMRNIFSTGECQIRIIEKINAFFKKKEARVTAILEDDNN